MGKYEADLIRDSSDEAIIASIHNSPVAIVIFDPLLEDSPIIEINQAFVDMTGYGREDAIGRNGHLLTGEATEPWVIEKINESVRNQRQVFVEILNYKKDGTPVRNAVLIAPVLNDRRDLRFFMGSLIELGDGDTSPSTKRHEDAVGMVKTMSPRQLEILKDMAAGFRNKQIAHRLTLSERTVKMHRAILLKKLKANSLADAVRIAVEAGL